MEFYTPKYNEEKIEELELALSKEVLKTKNFISCKAQIKPSTSWDPDNTNITIPRKACGLDNISRMLRRDVINVNAVLDTPITVDFASVACNVSHRVLCR